MVGATLQPVLVFTQNPTPAGVTSAPLTRVPTTNFPTIEQTPGPTFAPTTAAPTNTPAPTFPLVSTLTATAGSPSTFTINSRDRFGNPTGDASICTSVPSNCAFSFRINDGSPLQYAPAPIFDVSYKGSSRFLVSYIPFVTGVHNISVDIYSTQTDVFGSPYLLTVFPAALNSTLTTLQNLSHTWTGSVPGAPIINVAGVDSYPQVFTRDSYNNNWLDGPGNIRATVYYCPPPTRDCAGVTSGVETTVTSMGGGIYNVFLSGSFLTVAGTYLMVLRAVGTAFVPNGDSVYFTVVPDITAPSQTRTTYLNTTVVHSTTSITLQTFDKYGNPTIFLTDVMAVQYVIGSVGCITTGSVRDGFETIVSGTYPDATSSFLSNITKISNTNSWILSLSPLAVGRFTVNVTINSLPLACITESNLAFQVVPGPGWPPQSLISGPSSAVAGSVVTYTLLIRDQWQNPIMIGSANQSNLDVAFGVSCSAPLASIAPCPSSSVSTWLSTFSNGPMYPASGYPGCAQNPVSGLCNSVLYTSGTFITDLGNSTYTVSVVPVRAGIYTVVATFDGGLLSGPDIASGSPATTITILPNLAALYVPPNVDSHIQTVAGVPSFFDLAAADIYSNLVTANDHTFNLIFQQIGGPYSIRLSPSSQVN